MLDAREHHARCRDKYAARAARAKPGSLLADWWEHCAKTSERHRLEAVAASYSRRRPPRWVAAAPVKEVDPRG